VVAVPLGAFVVLFTVGRVLTADAEAPRATILAGLLGPICNAIDGDGRSSQALAHADLRSASPAEGATLTVAPAEIDLMFTQGVKRESTGVEITGPDKAAVETKDPMLMAGDRLFMATLQGTLAPVSIRWLGTPFLGMVIGQAASIISP